MRKVLTSVISSAGTNGQCQQLSGVGAFSGDKVICGDGSTGRRFCYGDDGGPMNYYNPNWGTFTVVGVAIAFLLTASLLFGICQCAVSTRY